MPSVSELKLLKRDRNRDFFRASVPDESNWDDELRHYDAVRVGKSLPAGPHAPNRNESRVLRDICSRTGLSEDEVRERKRYRRELAQAARAQGSGRHPSFRQALAIRRQVTAETGMHPRHPQFLAVFRVKWDARLIHSHGDLSAAQALAMTFEGGRKPSGGALPPKQLAPVTNAFEAAPPLESGLRAQVCPCFRLDDGRSLWENTRQRVIRLTRANGSEVVFCSDHPSNCGRTGAAAFDAVHSELIWMHRVPASSQWFLVPRQAQGEELRAIPVDLHRGRALLGNTVTFAAVAQELGVDRVALASLVLGI